MNKLLPILSASFFIILTSCTRDDDRHFSFEVWMTIFGFPLAGIAMGIGNWLLKMIGLKDKEDDDPFTIQTFIVGAVVLLIIYLLIF